MQKRRRLQGFNKRFPRAVYKGMETGGALIKF